MWHPVKQNTDDPCPCCGKGWMDLRAGKVTGSSIGKIMAKYGKAFGDPAKSLAVDVATIESGGQGTSNDYSNAYMERGHEQEPIAKQKYEDAYFVDVDDGGFYDNGQTGCSPDGLICGAGLIEIKSVINSRHFACISRDSFDPAYKWQLFFNLKESGLDWIDYVSFCATFPEDKRLFVTRIHKKNSQKEFEMIDIRLAEFRKLVETIKHKISMTS